MKSNMPKKRINSRQKGAAAEREVANILTAKNLCARRGQQFSGGTDSPDVVCTELPDVHFEVKRVQAGNLYSWFEQAVRDAGAKKPIVVHRRNGKPWVAIMDFDFALDLLKERELHSL